MAAVDVQAHHDAGVPPAGFEHLREVFAAHLGSAQGGMAFCVHRRGRPLVRLYGGSTVRRPDPAVAADEPWDPATLAVLFSGTKGLVATVAALLVDRGVLDVHRPVADYWPEFAAAGKAEVRVHQLLDHTVGLPYVDPEPPGEGAHLDNAANARVLAAQAPLWAPGTRVAYHAITYGYLLTELLHRVTGQGTGALIGQLLARPLGLELYLGLPPELDGRVATSFRADDYAISTFLHDPERRRIVDRMYGPTLLGADDAFNGVRMRRAQLAAGGGIATADAMARLYSLLADPTAPLVSAPTLAEATRTWSEGLDAVNDRPLRFGLGYELADPLGTYGPVEVAFGHSGAGGGLHGAWPEHELGFSFLTNEMLPEDRDHRAGDLLDALAGLL